MKSTLQMQWGDNSNITYDEAFIEKTWKSPAALYVMTDAQGNLVGTVAIDRKSYFPFISHLYVKPQFRRRGYGSKLLTIAEGHAAHQYTFGQSKLWCPDECVKFYEKRKWRKEKVAWMLKPLTGLTLMTKTV